MKGPFFLENRIRYEIYSDSNFKDVDIVVDKIKLKYDVVVTKQVEVFDSYWQTLLINQKYNVRIRHHDPVGLFIYAEDEQSNDMVTELANYLNKELFNGEENISNSNSI